MVLAPHSKSSVRSHFWHKLRHHSWNGVQVRQFFVPIKNSFDKHFEWQLHCVQLILYSKFIPPWCRQECKTINDVECRIVNLDSGSRKICQVAWHFTVFISIRTGWNWVKFRAFLFNFRMFRLKSVSLSLLRCNDFINFTRLQFSLLKYCSLAKFAIFWLLSFAGWRAVLRQCANTKVWVCASTGNRS